MNRDNLEKANKVIEKIEEYNQIWYPKDKYVFEHQLEGGEVFTHPIHMMDYLEEVGDEYERLAAKEFKTAMLDMPVNREGYEYVSRLKKEDSQRYIQYMNEQSKREFWHTHDGRNLIATYGDYERFPRELQTTISADLISCMLNTYLEDFTISEEESLLKIEHTLDEYFYRYAYAHLGYWCDTQKVGSLYEYWKKAGKSLPIDIIETKHEQYTQIEVDPAFKEYSKVPEREIQYRKFKRRLNGFLEGSTIENEYIKLKESFVKNFDEKDPKKPDTTKEKKEKGLEILKEIVDLKKSKDIVTRNAAYGFLARLPFDEELYLVTDILRRYEGENKKKNEKIGITYDEIFNHTFKDPKHISWEWFRNNRGVLYGEIYENAPYLYMDIVRKYVEIYCNDRSLSEKQKKDVRNIVVSLFRVDIKADNEKINNKFTDVEENQESKKRNKILQYFLTKREKQLIEEENRDFFKNTKIWSTYFKSNTFYKSLMTLFNNDMDLFNHVIDSLMRNSSNPKDSNYFDKFRMMNIIGKKLSDRLEGTTKTEKDILGSERNEIERRIMKDVTELCSCPKVKVTVNGELNDEKLPTKLFLKYLEQYGEIVDKIELENIQVTQDHNQIYIKYDSTPENLIESLKALGVNYTDQGESLILNIKDRHAFLNRVVGVLMSPTLFEWIEDDKENWNVNNEKLRTLFFVPKDINISYKTVSKDSPLEIFFSPMQKRHFLQNYLPWYLKIKHTTGDIGSLNTVLSAWLCGDMSDIKLDAYTQSKQISKNSSKIWEDLEGALGIVYEYERFRRSDLLKKFLLAINIEQIMPLVNNDRFQTSLIAASILNSTLKVAKDETLFKGIMQTASTLTNEFEGIPSLTYLAQEEKEKVERALKTLGFSQTEDGLELFRDIWTNFWYLRGFRGESQTLKITSSGIEISNPKRNMYQLEKRKNETDKLERKFEGGDDKLIISWSQIRDVKEVKIDLIPVKDLLINILTSYASITKQKVRPEIISKIENDGPGNITLRLPGRDEPLCEIFALHKPREFWGLLQNLSKFMLDEEASEDVLELLKVLSKN